MRKALVLALVLVFALSYSVVVFADNNIAVLSQAGAYFTADIAQTGEANAAAVTQYGGGNTVADKAQAYVAQTGDRNQSSIMQYLNASTGNTTIWQEGSDNVAGIFQETWAWGSTSAGIGQRGNDNIAYVYNYTSDDAYIYQTGDLNRAFIDQDNASTHFKYATIDQVGNSNYASVWQMLSYNIASVIQSGNYNLAQISQQ